MGVNHFIMIGKTRDIRESSRKAAWDPLRRQRHNTPASLVGALSALVYLLLACPFFFLANLFVLSFKQFDAAIAVESHDLGYAAPTIEGSAHMRWRGASPRCSHLLGENRRSGPFWVQ